MTVHTAPFAASKNTDDTSLTARSVIVDVEAADDEFSFDDDDAIWSSGSASSLRSARTAACFMAARSLVGCDEEADVSVVKRWRRRAGWRRWLRRAVDAGKVSIRGRHGLVGAAPHSQNPARLLGTVAPHGRSPAGSRAPHPEQPAVARNRPAHAMRESALPFFNGGGSAASGTTASAGSALPDPDW
jgi:hypothetical protein